MALRGRHLFEKRLSSPHPIFQKLLQEFRKDDQVRQENRRAVRLYPSADKGNDQRTQHTG